MFGKPTTIILIYTIEEIKLIRKWRAVQRFILFTDNKNIKTITKDYKPSVFNALGGEGTW